MGDLVMQHMTEVFSLKHIGHFNVNVENETKTPLS